MPLQPYYTIPTYANDGLRWGVVSFTSLASLLICGIVLPRFVKFIGAVSKQPAGVIVIFSLFFLAFLGVGFICVISLIGAIINPATYVTEAGVTQEGAIGGAPTSIAWGDVAQVNCRANHDGTVTGIGIDATGGRRIALNRNYMRDLAPVRDLLLEKVGSNVVHRCVSTNH
jgi:hypothetical protein